ncbi:MAG: hypothetical protein M0D53_11700 [Flavobacterium sp. JAD_PAG50586_2]|nr:MAG: hypothetical protein M0D53_11700 [Flavobacterium sp. JAD_PAG50586_2]
MRTSITFLGLIALSFTNANAITAFETQVLDQQESATVIVETSNNEVADLTDTTVFNPNSVIQSTYVKSVEEIIAENKLITQSQEDKVQPLSIQVSYEDAITEGNQIIESVVSEEVYPLNFEKINRTVKSVRVNNNTAITVDLKL